MKHNIIFFCRCTLCCLRMVQRTSLDQRNPKDDHQAKTREDRRENNSFYLCTFVIFDNIYPVDKVDFPL